ncbi:MAG: hypothetical protein E3J71_09230 [Candidatus Stahlbacteria bacterium]|nr:MAG: hypothetical protein E3J71_09230 [Candidatus Stahlbacteria bacterium]
MLVFSSLLLFASTAFAQSPYWIYLANKGEGRSPDVMRVHRFTAERRQASKLASKAGFGDIPLHPRYLRLIELSGARIRARSRWLNAVSVETDSMRLESLQAMPFVRSVEPVAVEIIQLPMNLIQRKEPIEPEHYGNTYTQLDLLNIPAVHNLGIFGQGVRIGFLDTGFKRDHTVFRTVRLGGEHDFITGDEIMLWNNGPSEAVVSNYEIVQQPELHGDWIFFIADSTALNATTARVLYAAHRSAGSVDAVLALSEPKITSTEGIARSHAIVTKANSDTMLVIWEAGSTNDYRRRDLHCGVLSNTSFKEFAKLPESNCRNPFVISDQNDTSLLFYVRDDGEVRMNRAVWTLDNVEWLGASQVFAPGGILDQPKASVSGDTIIVAALDLTKGALHLAQSLDKGQNFSDISSPANEEVVAFDLEGNYLTVAEIDPASGGFRLHSFETLDGGSSWTNDFIHPDVFEVIGSIDLLSIAGGGLHAVFESAGDILLTSSPGAVDSWSTPSILAQEFSYQPYLAFNAGELEVVWSSRGDEDTDYDPEEDWRDINGFSQPAHGSRTAALAVGYQGRSYIGASPGAELYVAKTEKHVNLYGSTYEMRVEEDMWIEGLEWLERNGVDIVNSSLAYGDWYSQDELDAKTSPASRAASMAAKRGVLITNAAGNVESAAPYISPPGDAYGIITVGGVDTLGNWWEHGAGVTGSAVGLPDDGRIKPELVAPAAGVYVIDVDDTISHYFYGNGTSYAAPLVAGIAALMLEVHPEYRGNPDTIISLLEQSASNTSSPNDTIGYGIPDAYQAILPLPADIDTFSRNELLPPYPNPFYPGSQALIYFPFRLNKASTRIRLRIFTLSGERVLEKPLVPLYATEEVDDEIAIGTYDDPADLEQIGAFWDGLTENGKPVASGLYLVVLSTQYGSHAAKFLLLR